MTGDEPIRCEVTFRHVREIARGGMGSVHEAVQDGPFGFTRRVAIKQIRPELLRCAEARQMFVAEAKLAAGLVHQHIVQLHHLGQDGERLFMVLEYVHGVTLAQLVQRHRQRREAVPTELAVYIASRVARALQYAHGRDPVGIVHLDVNAGNVLVDSEGVVKLTDFGIARALERAGCHEAAGEADPAGLSVDGLEDPAADRRADVVALGALLTELLTLRNPFPGRRWTVRTGQLPGPELPGRPSSVVDLVDRMLQRRDPMEDAGTLARLLELEIYSEGYGPTFTTLAGHLRERFPEL